MTSAARQVVARYVLAVGVAALVTVLKLVLINPLVGGQQWFLLFVAAICLSSWYGGFGPGAVTAVLCALSADLFFVGSSRTFDTSPSNLLQVVLFLVEGLLVVGFTGHLRETRMAAERSEYEKDQALALLDTFQTYAPVGLAYLDFDLRYVRINYAMAELDGLTPAAHIGRTLQEVRPQIQPELIAAIKQVLETGKPLLDQEHVLTKPTLLGLRRQYLLTSYYRIRDNEGKPLGVGAVMVDMTEARRAEEALRESEARFRTMADTAPVMIWVADTNMQGTYYNKVWLDFTGRTLEQELGNGFLESVHPDDRERFVQHYTAAFETHQAYETEYRLRRHDGEYRWVFNQAVPRYTADGTYVGYIGSTIDITERKQAEIGFQFVMQAGVMLASTLDYETTLTSVAKLAVPTIADWCAVDLLTPEGGIERVTVAHVDPEKVKWAYELQERYPVDMSAPTGLPNVIRTGKTEFYPEITEGMLEEAATDAETYQILKEIGFTSVIIAPMIARGRVIGALTLVSTESRRHYNQIDVRVAELLAVRAGLSVDNSRLYGTASAERERFRVTLSSIGDAVIATDHAGNITFMNAIAQNLTGWQEADAQGKPLDSVFNIVNEQSRQPVENPVTKVIREKRVVGLANHTVLISKSGSAIPIDDSGAPIHDENGNIQGVVLVFRDVTESKRENSRHQFLTEASSLLISSLDYETTLRNIARLAVPSLADWCIVHLLNDDGDVYQVAVYHLDPEMISLREKMISLYPPRANDSFGHMKVFTSGQPELIEHITDEVLQNAAYNPEHLEMLHQIHYRSSICVPLRTSSATLGTLTLRISDDGRAFDTNDLSLVQELGHVVSLAIENARLYRKAQGM